MGNRIRTTILLAALTAVIIWFGQWLGGRQGMIIALFIAGAMNFFSYWYSDKLILKTYRAREASPAEAPDLYHLVKRLAMNAELPMPRVYIIPQESPNAFATGRNPEHAVVAVTDGLLRLMDEEELAGVLAHELAHVQNRDILIGSVAATLAGTIMVLASMARWSAMFGGMRGNDDEGGAGVVGLIVMSVIAPMAAMLIQMAISRSREYLADSTGSRIAGSPGGLARALTKLGAYSQRIPMDASPQTAHMFIVNPLSGRRVASLFATHPPIEERVARLTGRPAEPPAAHGHAAEKNDPRTRQGRDFWDGLS